MGLSPLTFSGVSSYSQDFRTILDRTVTIASFPLEALKNEQSDVLAKKQLTEELNGAVELFREKIEALATVADDKAISGTSSNAAKVSIDSVNTDLATVYSITEVTSLASAASETSLAAYANSASTTVSASGSLRLTVGAQQYNFSLASGENNLLGLRDKINGLGAGVTAAILTVGPTENYLSITANGTGQKALSLVEDPSGAASNVLTSANQGSNLSFKLNGVAVTRTSNQVIDLVPGVSFTVKGTTAGNESVSLTLASDRSKISTALTDFASAYNALQEKVSAQIGAAAGLLSGDLLVREAQGFLRRASSFGLADGTVRNWSDFGVTFSQTGALEFDSTVFSGLGEASLTDVFRFFRTEDGLGELSGDIAGYTDEVNGLAKVALDQYEESDLRLTSQIGELTERIRLMRDSYLAKLQAADALLGQLEGQQQIVDASISSLNLVLLGKKDN
jgi:flagellar hook-associated protein 2